ncbi:thiamine ABC transporter ATP-binding protein, partial [Dickeya undicola]
MLSLVDEICRERQLTLLMVSHQLEDAMRIAPRSVLVVDGHVYHDGPTGELARHPNAARILGLR